MPIPNYETIMLPLLKFASEAKEHSAKEAIESLSHNFKLTNEEKSNYNLEKFQFFMFEHIGGLNYLKHAGLLIRTRRSFFKINER